MKKSATLALLVAVGASGTLPPVRAATVHLDTNETDPDRRWFIDGQARLVPGTDITVFDNSFNTDLQLDEKSSFNTQWLHVLNSTDVLTGTIKATIERKNVDSTPALRNLTANGSGDSLIGLYGEGAIARKQLVAIVGPSLDVSVNSYVQGNFSAARFGDKGPSSVYSFQSKGVDGYNAVDPSVAAPGGPVSVNLWTQYLPAYNVTALSASGKTVAGSSSLPWQAGAALLTALSRGGDGGLESKHVYAGADGGPVSVAVGKGALLEMNVEGQADSPAVGILALSKGGAGGVNGSEAGDNGAGGSVDVRFSGGLTGSQPYTMGVVAASVGGATQYPLTTHPRSAGGAGDVSLTLSGGSVNLASTNAIGLVATSTADTPFGSTTGSVQGAANKFGNVTVSLDAGSSVSVGNTTDKPSATDTTIGVLANSAVAWVSTPFLGAVEGWSSLAGPLGSPGQAGNVTINNQGSVSASGQGAIGILAQSIAGNGASLTGGTRPFVGEAGSAGGVAGNLSYTGNGGTITATGDGAVGLMMQSIAGGGGNGGNAAGLFVAVGGRGGAGGLGGIVNFSQQNGARITTKGDYAQGVVLQSVGGGGGNGGYSKAYSLGEPASAAIGGSGAVGGAGGFLLFGGRGSGNTSQITTSGRHAHGVVAQTIGSGGGKGGAAHSYNGSILLTVSLGVGGQGGNGGNGGLITGADLSSPAQSFADITTTGHDAHGMLLQSIGGGGGVGGGSTADAFSMLSAPELPTINASFAIGGSGGMGGDGGLIWFDLANTMSTRGASSSGLVLQSVGGGGGMGGDATAGTAAILANSEFTMNMSVGVGGTGGGGGKGGDVVLSLAGTQSTRGHNGAAIIAHSVGGGGGIGGVGNAATVVALPLEESNYQVALGVGGSGGKGGVGGDVTISTPGSSSVLSTLGSGASALVAQSVGGGGGVAGDAGTQGIGGKLTVKLAVGGSGGSGNHGGDVRVDYTGQITTGGQYQARYATNSGGTALTTPITVGGSSHGIVAQSVGGGGGTAGNADPSKSVLPDLAETIIEDANKVLDAKGSLMWVASRVVDYEKEKHEFPRSYSVGIGVGGTGGSGGDGGAVQVSLGTGTQILTHGHRSYGVLAQSVGGGGGEGGAASGDAILDAEADLSPLTGADFDLGVNVGGAGGAAGKGGNVTINADNFGGSSDQNNRVVTLGYGAHALFLQSVGGGGGIGHEGSILGLGTKLAGAQVPELTLGSPTSTARVSGDGGSVAFSADARASRISLIQTLGDDASAVFAQSVGGGGGLASAGCTNSGRVSSQGAGACHTNAGRATGDSSADATPQQFVNRQLQYQLKIAPNGAGANGGSVSINPPAGTLATSGDRSPVIVAQSIGGGGGYMTAHAANISGTSIGHVDGGSGGGIYMGFGQVNIRAEGSGSWGILAQSIASGGGVAGDLAGDLQFQGNAISSSRKSGVHGGDISIALTSGTHVQVGMGQSADGIVNAHGVVAQSLGSSGGIRSQGGNLVFEGSNGPDHGYGGSVFVDVTHAASVETRAIGGVGVLAHSAGVYANDNKQGIDISVSGGSVTGGVTGRNPATGALLDGVGILVVGGAASGAGFFNTITVDSGGLVTTQGGTDSGYAIKTLDGVTNVTNSGMIAGSIDLGDTPGILINNPAGTLNMGAVYRVGDNSLHNYGLLNVGTGTGVETTVVQGRLNQYDSGRTVLTVDAANTKAANDRLIVNGIANIGGVLEVQANSLLPGSYPVVQATDLNFTGTVKDSLLFDWRTEEQGESLSLRPAARLGLQGLDATAASLAGYLQRGWLNADASKARVFGYLNQVGSLDQYRSTLQQLGGQQLHAQVQQMVSMSYDMFSDSMQCPLFRTPGVAMSQSGCAWARVTGNRSDQSARDYNLGYRAEGGGLRVGMQRELDNRWRIGATFGANLNRLTADNFSSKGQVYDLSVSLSRSVGAWTFTGALAGAYGRFNNDRTVQLGAAGSALGLNATYASRSYVTLLGARFRTAYDIPFQSSYLRPYLDVDLLHTRSPAFNESGQGPLGLAVGSTSKTQVVVSPMLEIGTSHALSDGTLVRGYASAGLSLLPGNARVSQNRFNGALGVVGNFDARQEGPSAVGRFNLGVQVVNQDGLALSAEYGLQAGGSFRSQTVGARLTYRF